MSAKEATIRQVRRALENEPRINLHRFPISVGVAGDDVVVLEGDVESLAAKKLALELAAAAAGIRDAGEGRGGGIEVAVADGVATLEGTVISLSHKRVAGVLAWWTPGCRDVVNSLAVVPGEEDGDAEVVEALRLVLEMDPLVPSDQVTVSCRNFVVTLDGCVGTDAERRQAERDAWALFAVDKVINRITLGA